MSIVKTKKSRIRGPNLRPFVRYAQSYGFEKTLYRADDANLVIASNSRIDTLFKRLEDMLSEYNWYQLDAD
jgi:hypothetical protein